MAKPKKNGVYLNVCIDKSIYDRLERVCKSAGQTKTTVVERALSSYLDYYDNIQKKLKELGSVEVTPLFEIERK